MGLPPDVEDAVCDAQDALFEGDPQAAVAACNKALEVIEAAAVKIMAPPPASAASAAAAGSAAVAGSAAAAAAGGGAGDGDEGEAERKASLSGMRVAELRKMLDARGVSHADCVEKGDLVAKVLSSGADRPAPTSSAASSSAAAAAGASSGGAADSGKATVLPMKLRPAARDVYDVLSSVQFQQQDWMGALSTSRRWIAHCGPASVKPFAAGMRAVYSAVMLPTRTGALLGDEETKQARAAATEFVSGITQRENQRELRGGRDGISAGFLVLEQAQTLALFADLMAHTDSSTPAEAAAAGLEAVRAFDDRLQDILESDESGLDALEAHEQARVMGLVGFIRMRSADSDTARADAAQAMAFMAEESVRDALASAEATRTARDAKKKQQDGSGGGGGGGDSASAAAAAGSAEKEEEEEGEDAATAALRAQLLAGLGGGPEAEAALAGEDGLSDPVSTYSLATDYIPTPLDLGLGFLYALLAVASLEAARALTGTADAAFARHVAKAAEALEAALEGGMEEDENVLGACLMYDRDVPDATGEGKALAALLSGFRSDDGKRQAARTSALRASNVLIQRRVQARP